MRTEALNKIDELEHKIDELRIQQDKIRTQERKYERYNEARKLRAERKRWAANASKKFVGKWLFVDDGIYIHVSGIDAPTKESAEGYLSGGEGYLVFPTHYDMRVEIGGGIIDISNGTSKGNVLYFTLYSSSDGITVKTKDVMEELESKLGEILSNYKALCKQLKWKPSVCKSMNLLKT